MAKLRDRRRKVTSEALDWMLVLGTWGILGMAWTVVGCLILVGPR